MARLAQTAGLTEVQQEILSTVRTFVEKEIVPEELEHGDIYPQSRRWIEWLMREAPFLLIGEGTSEIRKTVISKGLLRE